MINFEPWITEKNGELRDMPIFEKFKSTITKTKQKSIAHVLQTLSIEHFS